jgi:hypothetical protein
MPIETIQFKGENYPALEARGGASLWARPFALEFCKGLGLDIGYGKQEWKFPGAIGVDLVDDNGFDAYNLPKGEYDYIHSSHLLEHLPDWVGALDHWSSRLKSGGVMFLYLPSCAQQYWWPWNNRKHISILHNDVLEQYFVDRGFKNVFATPGHDLNHSFYVVAEKP